MSGSAGSATGRPALHFDFPLRLDGGGRTALADDERYLRGLIEQVLFTRPGERVNRPDFGSAVDAMVFAPAGDEAAGATQALVQGALQRHLGELLRVNEIEVVADGSTLEVTIVYTPLRAPFGDGARVLRVRSATGSGRGTP